MWSVLQEYFKSLYKGMSEGKKNQNEYNVSTTPSVHGKWQTKILTTWIDCIIDSSLMFNF
jgi:hypothetical protein